MSSEVYKRYRERARSFSWLAGIDAHALTLTGENGIEEQTSG
jgi:hypothetical protein